MAISALSEGLISFSELATRLKRSMSCLRNWREREDRPLEAIKIGGSWYTTEEALNRFSQRSAPEPIVAPDTSHEDAMQALQGMGLTD